MSSGPHTERQGDMPTVRKLDWPEARHLAELYRQALGVVPRWLVMYVETGDPAWLDRGQLAKLAGEPEQGGPSREAWSGKLG